MPIVLSVQRKALEIRRSQLRQALGLEVAPIDSGGDEGDQVAARELRLITFSTHQHRQAELRDVEAALERIRDGVYGKCLSCGDAISERRLAAIPQVAHCLTCQIQTEQERGRRESAVLRRLTDSHADAGDELIRPPIEPEDLPFTDLKATDTC